MGTARATAKTDLEQIRVAIQSGERHRLYAAWLLGLRVSEKKDLIERVRRGFPYSAFGAFMRHTGLSQQAVSDLTHIPPRTLVRRRQKGKLAPDESDRLLRASRVFARALELFEGDVDASLNWLTNPHVALGDLAPLSLADTEVGASEVENLIGRLEHGIPS